ncbi:MAG TPA: HIT family protein [Acidimicrobiales bacterium]|nr:HIT family protein [Acidimicrobiales bacterium]
MSTLFTRIIDGELPGRFVWRDERCVAFLSINPLQPGHTLVVPIAEVDQWTDLPVELAEHLMRVAHVIGRAQVAVFTPERVGLVVAGYEVPHCHVHVIPTRSMADLDFANAARDPDPAGLDDAADRLRAALVAAGHTEAG